MARTLRTTLIVAAIAGTTLATAQAQPTTTKAKPLDASSTTKPSAKTPLLPKAPKPQTASTQVATEAPVLISSLVGTGGDAARRWITPLLDNSNKRLPGDQIQFEYSRFGSIQAINPDTRETVRVRTICYNPSGERVGEPRDTELTPLSAANVGPVLTSSDRIVWCQIDSAVPIIAFAYITHYRRNKPETYNEQMVVPLFKAIP